MNSESPLYVCAARKFPVWRREYTGRWKRRFKNIENYALKMLG
jgi:hypothetical protein